MDIISYLIRLIQQLYQQICWLVQFICKFIPLKQWAFDDSHSPKYQKFKVDALPRIVYHQQDWDWKDLNSYYTWKYGMPVTPVRRRSECSIPDGCTCPSCKASSAYLYRNNGKQGQLKCPYYLHNLKKVDKEDLNEDYGKNKYKLHYVYREFTVDFFKFDITTLPKNASSLKFTKNNAYIMSLCLTLHVNLGLSLRKTSQALKDLYGISVSRQMAANYCKTAAICVKPFVDTYPYEKDPQNLALTADETYIKVRGVKGYIWFIMNAATRAIVGCQASDNRGVDPCIMAMRMAFQHLKELPRKFLFAADAYSAYPLAAQQFFRQFGDKFRFGITQVVGLTNDDAVSKEFRPYKQMIERLNRTYKASYRPTNGFDGYDGVNYNLALWVAYYNFLRPHKHLGYKPPAEDDVIKNGNNMPGKWQLLIFLGQQTILNMQQQASA